MSFRLPLIPLAACLIFHAALPAAEGEPWAEMDYGRFVSASFNNNEGKTTLEQAPGSVNKGIAIRLGHEGRGTMVFDTDLMRMAAAWTGGFFQTTGVTFDGQHGINPKPAEGAQTWFRTSPASPGWSQEGKWEDPRKLPAGPAAATVPFGPLPSTWAKYRGLYLHGDDVVLAYFIGTAPVLESPGMEEVEGQPFITRTVNVLGKGGATAMLLGDMPAGGEVEVENGMLVVHDNPAQPDSRLVLAVRNPPSGSKLEVVGGRLVLTLDTLAGSEVFKVIYWKGVEAGRASGIAAMEKVTKPEFLAQWTKGGPAHWAQETVTTGALGEAGLETPYAVDTLTLPVGNSYKSWMRLGALDFFANGSIAVSTWSGDVWIVKGVDEKLDKLTWHRFATGLFQPFGLKIVDEQIYVLGRDQITRLYDLNGDGEADLYESFNNDVQVTPGFHEFAFDLQTNAQGDFFFTKGGPVRPGGAGFEPLSDHNGCVLKVTRDGGKLEVVATGLRTPNGLGLSPSGELSVGDNQGSWVPVDFIHFIKPGEFIEVPDLAHRTPRPDHYTPHLCWLPYDLENSGAGHTWVTSEKWGPFKGDLLYLSYGKSALFKVLREKPGETVQGGVVQFPLKFESGLMRGRFSPADGQLYVCGLHGWQTNSVKDGTLARVRYTGGPVTMPTALRVTNAGLHLGFTAPVDAASAGQLDHYSLEQYNYQWSSGYGSAEFKVSNPAENGRDSVEIKSVRVSPDGREVFFEVPGLQPVMQMRLKLKVQTQAGVALVTEVAFTINGVENE